MLLPCLTKPQHYTIIIYAIRPPFSQRFAQLPTHFYSKITKPQKIRNFFKKKLKFFPTTPIIFLKGSRSLEDLQILSLNLNYRGCKILNADTSCQKEIDSRNQGGKLLWQD